MVEASEARGRGLLGLPLALTLTLALTPASALTAAQPAAPQAPTMETVRVDVGARWIGAGDEFGTVEVGKRANLLLVDGDPLTDIRALREVELVLKDGVVVFGAGR